MIDLVKRFFGMEVRGGPEVRDREQAHDIRVATCALLLEMAHIDGEFTESEREHILAILKRDYGLPDEYAQELLAASLKELEGSIDLWQFTNLINRNYSVEEKIGIIEMVWRIAFTDGKLDKYEDYLVHKLARLLHLTHRQLIEAKLKVLHAPAQA